jgi:IclR family transcriptional regulator, KDG regulon repressor
MYRDNVTISGTSTTQSLDRAICILDCFSSERNELGVREVARLTSLSPSTAGRLMAALKDLNLLNQNPATRCYSLGGKVLAWAGVYASHLDVRTLALPHMQSLLASTQETVSLYIIEGGERLCVERLESSRAIHFSARVGRRLPITAGAAGKVLLAFLPPAQREEILAAVEWSPFTEQTIIDPAAFRAELESIHQKGYAVSMGEWQSDAAGVAAPILGPSSAIQAAMTISGPVQRYTPEVIEAFVAQILAVTRVISGQMGYTR